MPTAALANSFIPDSLGTGTLIPNVQVIAGFPSIRLKIYVVALLPNSITTLSGDYGVEPTSVRDW